MKTNSGKSSNYFIVKDIISKSRTYKFPKEIDYIIIYTFLYKYCSDNLKDHYQMVLQDKEMTLDEAYEDEFQHLLFKEDGLKLWGFFIEKPEAFLDEVINTGYTDRFFLERFFRIFPNNIIFDEENKDKQYFNYLFSVFSEEIPIHTYEWNSEEILAIKEIILSISKLNLFENNFSFANAFEIISSSRLMNINYNPDYLSQILSSLVTCEKTSIKTVYDPFMKNASSLIELSRECESIKKFYGKESDKLTYCFTLVKLFINGYMLDNIILKHEDATQSIDIDGASFDVILSKVPVAIKNYYSSNINQNFEIAKRNKRVELEEVLLKQFGIDSDSFVQDVELNYALENLLEKMDVEKDFHVEFIGEYESLKDSEFLFLINLINCLNDDGIMAICISQNFLFKNSLETLRKYLTYEKNYIESIISIPDELGRSKPEVAIVFKKNRQNNDILFVDMSKKFNTQRGGISLPGLFRRNLILADETIDKLKDVVCNKSTIARFSNLVNIDEIIKNKFDLAVSRYVDTFEGEFIKLKDLADEKREIDENINKLNLKIEEMMDDLNISR